MQQMEVLFGFLAFLVACSSAGFIENKAVPHEAYRSNAGGSHLQRINIIHGEGAGAKISTIKIIRQNGRSMGGYGRYGDAVKTFQIVQVPGSGVIGGKVKTIKVIRHQVGVAGAFEKPGGVNKSILVAHQQDRGYASDGVREDGGNAKNTIHLINPR